MNLRTRHRLVPGALLIGVLTALWHPLLGWLAERLGLPAPVAYASLLAGMLVIGCVGGYLLRSRHAIRIVPVAVAVALVAVLVAAEFREMGESTFVVNMVFLVAPAALAAALGAALGVLIARRVGTA